MEDGILAGIAMSVYQEDAVSMLGKKWVVENIIET